MTTILGIKINNRNDNATKVQNILTKFGCYINTRLGLHSQEKDYCSQLGLVLIEITNNKKAEEIETELSTINDIALQKMVF